MPVWLVLSLETRLLHGKRVLVRETRIGRSRGRLSRGAGRTGISIDRRSIERRTQDVLGTPLHCARFETGCGPVGRWIARRGLTTLPLLLNVIRCEMALVGPRPETEEYVLRWKHVVPDYDRRFNVLPGITGLAHVSGYSDAE